MNAVETAIVLAIGLGTVAPAALAQDEELPTREEGQIFIIQDEAAEEPAEEETAEFTIGIDETEPDRPVASIRIDPAEVEAGTPAEGFIGLEAPLLQTTGELEPVTITLSSSDPSAAIVPAEIMTTRYSASFAIETGPVSRPTTVLITAEREGGSAEAYLTVLPVPPDLASLDVNPGRLRAGRDAKAMIRLVSPAEAEATMVLTAEPAGLVTMPAKVTVAPGDRFARFDVSAADPGEETEVTITATVGEGSAVRSVSTIVRVVP